MKTKILLALTLIAKLAGFVGMLGVIPGISFVGGASIVAGASIVKDLVNRIGDFIDNGKADGSFKS